MSEASAEPVRVRPRESLSGRLWLLTTLAVLLSEVVVFFPYIAHERRSWLDNHIEDASIATLAIHGDGIDGRRIAELLRLSDAVAIRMAGPDAMAVTLGDPTQPVAEVDPRNENLFTAVRRALRALIFDERRLLRVTTTNPFDPNVEAVIFLKEQSLTKALRAFASEFAVPAVLIAGVTGGLVYFAVLILLVRPIRRLTGSIAAFRADPERTTPLDPGNVSVLSNDEVTVAGRELAAMQHELRAALWRNARLAGIGTVVAKVSHDLRGILTPALLTAERLQLNPDPKVQRAGETLAQAVDRATDLVRRTLDYAREGPPPLLFAPVGLAPLVDEAAETARPLRAALRLVNTVDVTILVHADRTQLFRVFANLLRNAAEAGARTVRITAQHNSPTLSLDIADDGPGLPDAVQAELFRPFAGSMHRGGTGLGLAIARDLMVAHGGTIELVETGSSGTTFRLTLRLATLPASSDGPEQRAGQAPEPGRIRALP
jgi:signal transduction histidine kinase